MVLGSGAMTEPWGKDLLTGVALEDPDGALVGIGCIVVATHATLEGEELVETREHVGVVLLRLVVEYEATLPERTDGLDALELVGLSAGVAGDGELVATDVALGGEVVEDDVLHEVRPNRRIA